MHKPESVIVHKNSWPWDLNGSPNSDLVIVKNRNKKDGCLQAADDRIKLKTSENLDK